MHFGFGEKERHRLREKKEKPLLVISSPCKQEGGKEGKEGKEKKGLKVRKTKP